MSSIDMYISVISNVDMYSLVANRVGEESR